MTTGATVSLILQLSFFTTQYFEIFEKFGNVSPTRAEKNCPEVKANECNEEKQFR